MTTENDWLSTLKVGDTVAVEHGGFSGTVYSIAKVVRRTPTGRISVSSPGLGERSVQFDKHGRHRVDQWASWRLAPVTQKVTDKIERARLVAKLSAQKWQTMDLAHLRAVWSALRDAQAANTPPGSPESRP